MGISSLRLWLPFRVSPMHHRERLLPSLPGQDYSVRPFRGLLPFNVLPAAQSHISPAGTTPNRLRCAPRVSHPLDALLPTRPAGFISSRIRSWAHPFEALILTLRRTLFRAPRPSRVSTASADPVSPPRDCPHNAKPHRRSRGLVEMPRRLPPWAFPPSRFLTSCNRWA